MSGKWKHGPVIIAACLRCGKTVGVLEDGTLSTRYTVYCAHNEHLLPHADQQKWNELKEAQTQAEMEAYKVIE